MQRVVSSTRLAQDHAGSSSSSSSSPSSSVSPRTPAITMAANNHHEESRFWSSTERGVVVMDAAGEQISSESKGKHTSTNNITGFLGGMLNRERKRSTKLANAPVMVNLPSSGGSYVQRPSSSSGGASSALPQRTPSNGSSVPPKTRKLRRNARPSTANDVDRPRSRSGLFSMLSASRSEHDLNDPSTRTSRPSTASGVPARERIIDDDNVQEVLAAAPRVTPSSLAPRRSLHSSEGRHKRSELPEALHQMSLMSADLSSPSESESSSIDDNVDLSQFPLPVRLGIVPPSELSQSRSSRRVSAAQYSASRRTSQKLPSFLRHRPQYVDGYYLCTPPPPPTSSFTRSGSSRSSYGTSQTTPTSSPIGRARGNSDVRRTNFFGSPTSAKVLQPSESGATSYGLSAREAAQPWAVKDYFRVERVRRPGQFGVSELKTHAYSHDEAPYPFSYGTDSMSSDMLMHITIEKAVGLSTLQWPHGPPRRVLDIGCGIGAWVMDMASVWPEAEFIGLDLVPIQRTLDPIDAAASQPQDKDAAAAAKPAPGSMADLHRRVSWVVANALQGLPFPDASFDCVNISLINAGIPQQKWPALLADVSRVLTPGGQLQLLEWDFSFFGSSQEISTADLMNLILGNPSGDVRAPAQLCRAPFSRQSGGSGGDSNARRRDRRNAALEAIFAHALRQRNVSLTPSTMLEPHLHAMDDVANVFLSEPRSVPILSRSHRKTFARTRLSDTADLVKKRGSGTLPASPTTAAAPEISAAPTGLDELIGLNYAEGEHLFASSQQAKESDIPALVVRIHDLDAVRMAIMTSDALRYSDCRHYFWQELETLRRQDACSALAAIRQRVAAAAASEGYGGDNVGGAGGGDNASAASPAVSFELRACLQRWPTFSAFECDMDAWKKEMQLRADSEELLRHKMRWGDAATRMDGWQQTEKMRKRREQQYWTAVNDKVVVRRVSDADDEHADPSKLKAGGTAMLNALKTQAAHAAAVAMSIQHATPLPDFVRPDIVSSSVPFSADACEEKAKASNRAVAAEEDDDEEDGDQTVRQRADVAASGSACSLGLPPAPSSPAPEPAHETTDILGFRVASLFNVRKRDAPHGANSGVVAAAE